jgi:hypothetical protein
MNCREYQRQIDIGFKQSGYEISGELVEHIQSCSSCSAYLRQLESLQEALNRPLAILPGELDDITWETIGATAPDRKKERRPAKFARLLKWSLVPAAITAAVILVIMLFKPGAKNDYSGMSIDPYTTLGTDNSILSSDSLSIQVLSSMAADDASLDRAADELLSGSDIDDLLGNLTPDELKALYDKIDNLKG